MKYFVRKTAVLAVLAVLVTAIGCKQPVTGPEAKDTTPPAEVTNLKAEALTGAVRLTWTDPADADLWGIEISSEQEIIPSRAAVLTPEKSFIVAKGQQSIKIANLSAGESYTFTVKTIDTAGNKSTGETTKPKQPQSGGSPMTLTLTQAPARPAWSQDKVTVTVQSSTTVQKAAWTKKVQTVKEMLKNGKAINNKTFEVTENGTYFVAVQDNDGRREVETIEITNIDKTPPPTPSNLTVEYRFGEKKIILKWTDLVDKESGVKELKLTYTVNGANATTETIAKGKQTFEITGVEPQSPPVPYAFSLKAVDTAGNEGAAAAATVKPSDQAEVTKIEVSPKKIEYGDPDKKVTVTLYGFNLAKAAEIKITGAGVTPVTLSNVTGSSASAEFTLPNTVKDTVFKVYIKHPSAADFTLVNGVTAKTCVCDRIEVTKMKVTKQDGSKFETDNYGALKVEAGTGGFMKIVLTGTNLDTDGLKAGVRFNGEDCESTANGDGTELTIENIEIPAVSGVYPIQAQLKPRYKTEYTIVPDSSYFYGYKSNLLRVLGDVVLKELRLSGYDKTLEGSERWLLIKGENLDNLTADDLSNITSSLGGGVTHAKIIDSTTLKADYIIPDLLDDSAVGKTETLTIAGKTVSAPLHTFEIHDDGRGRYYLRRYYSIPSDGKVQIPEYVDDIYSDAFKNCTALTSIDLSGTKLTDIQGKAFSGCTGLTEVKLPANLKYIGDQAFCGCKELTSVTFPASLTEIDYGAFSACVKLASVDLSATKLTQINSSTFAGCAGLTEVTLPASLTEIGVMAFAGCKELTSVTFPASLTEINREAFSACVKLASVDLSATKLTQINSSAFDGCAGLTEVTLPASLTSIGAMAFNGCAGLTSAVFADTAGWAVYDFLSDEKYADIQATDLQNPATAAEYVRTKYYNKKWKKN